ncbi:MAG TPA: hypothetical protein VFR47_18695 [Anaerolineales bacterium]|nr:hypothetical protein [Anaerolineales bacterium]
MAYTQLKPRHTPGARVEEIARESAHYRLSIPSGFADSYRLAQLDDYTKISRGRFPHRASLSLSLLACASSDSIAGTWGFGLWNDPFGLSLGFGGSPFRLPALPNAAWFFGASEENYLSFKEPSRPPEKHRDYSERTLSLPKRETKRELQTKSQFESSSSLENRTSSTGSVTNAPPSAQRETIAANGFLVQTFCAPKFHPLLAVAGLALPFSRKMTRRLLGRVIQEDGVQLWSPATHRRMQEQAPALQSRSEGVNPTQWHRYRLEWREQGVTFEVDEALVLESHVSPNPPLGLVIWIDNQYAAFTPEGKIGFGVLANPEPAWLEVKEIELKSL